MTPAPDFRALCAELTVKLEYWMSAINRRPLHSVELVDRARAALATPPPEPPTVMEIIALGEEIEDSFVCCWASRVAVDNNVLAILIILLQEQQ